MGMPASYRIIGAVGVALGVALVQTSCFFTVDLDDCSWNPSPHCFSALDGGPDADSGSDGGPDSGPPPSCIPSMNSEPVAASCGVFVSATGSDTTGKGTPTAPYKTLGKALAENASTIYACAGTTPYSEALAVDTRVTLFGALNCGTWAYNAAVPTQLTAASDAVPLTLSSSASGSAVYDFGITAVGATMTGGSSIAVLDNGADVALENVAIAAGAGQAGAPGAPQTQVATPGSANGANGNSDGTCMNTGLIMGGAGGINTCADGTMTNGGAGGQGIPAVNGEPGSTGQPTMTGANGGAGQTTTPCQPGGLGNEATAGAAATGMPGTGARGIGDVSASGYQPPAPVLGTAGSDGQGGGGGGGAHACDSNNMYAGPSGGGGGAGGCGGNPGNAGTSGGSSVGILAVGAKLTLTTVSITTTAGGMGGAGASGQLGGNGGQQGNQGGSGACPGGVGGQGGAGGSGGGGAGGHSVAIAIKNATLPDLGTTTITPGSGGTGGAGADMTTQTAGDDGKACKTLDFTAPTSPTACSM